MRLPRRKRSREPGPTRFSEHEAGPVDAIVVGRLLKAHGLAGEILASIDTGDPELVFTPGREFGFAIPAGDPPRSLTLETARPHKGGYLLRFREIADIVGAPESTVKSRMYYGLRGLRAALEREGYDAPGGRPARR